MLHLTTFILYPKEPMLQAIFVLFICLLTNEVGVSFCKIKNDLFPVLHKLMRSMITLLLTILENIKSQKTMFLDIRVGRGECEYLCYGRYC